MFQIKEFKEVIGKTKNEYEQAIKLYQYKTLWTYIANCILGLWLICSPFFYDYKSSVLAISDIISGLLIILVELLSFSLSCKILRYCISIIALWLLFAPLVFWAKTPAVYSIDTLIACLIIALSILVPGMPEKAGIGLPGPDQPPGWTYNPSSWIRRWLGIALALMGFFMSRYLSAHQLGYVPHAWDPFFGTGSDKVTSSIISRSFPISDAGLGSVAYILEVLTGFMGDRARWRTAPWIAVMFAILVLPLGATSMILVVMQPVAVSAWCGLCLISAAGLLISVPLAVHEAIAVGQFLVEAKAQNKNFWQVFWMGGSIIGAGANDPDRTHYSFAQRWIASVQGVTVPWTIVAQLCIGIWLMSCPDIFSFNEKLADCDYILGALVVSVAAVSAAEVTRIVRFINVPLGLLLMIATLLFSGHISPIIIVSELIASIFLVIVSIPKGDIFERYAGWDKFVK